MDCNETGYDSLQNVEKCEFVKTGVETVILYVRAQINEYPYFRYFLADLGQFGIQAVH